MKEKIKLSIFWIFSFLVIIFMMTFSSQAESLSSYFPMQQNDNNIFTEGAIEYLNNYFDTDNNYVIIYSGYVSGKYRYIYFVQFPKSSGIPIYAEILNNGYQFSLYYVDNTNLVCGRLAYNMNNNTTYHLQSQGNSITGFNGVNSSLYDNSVAYLSNFNLYNNFNDDRQLVLYYEPESNPPLDIGIAIIPPQPIIPDFDNLTQPSKVPPTYTTSDYTWTTPPTFDSSSIENAIGSIQNILGWLANNLKEEFKNLTDNLEGFFKYIGETIQYYAGIIIDTLNNFIQNFYDNMANLVQPIFEKINYITEPLDQDIIFDNIGTTSLVTNINTIQTSLTSFQAAFTGVSEPSSYTIPIHLENLPSNWFGNQTTQYIDLGVINGTVKDGLRLFVWAMVTYSLVVTIFDSISNYINGGGDES